MRQYAHSLLARASRAAPSLRGKTSVGTRVTRGLIGSRPAPIERVTMRDGTTMLLDPHSRTEIGAFWTGDYEPSVVRFLKSSLPGGGVMLDVGANIGFITVAIAKHLSVTGGQVLAFEPVASNFARLQQNLAINHLSNATAFNVALGSESGKASISLENQGGAETGNAVLEKAAGPGGHGSRSTITIRRLDDMPEVSPARVDLIKADVEGAEVAFVRGAQRFIERYRPVIFGEFNAHWTRQMGDSVLDAWEILRPLGYGVHQLTDQLRPVDQLRDGMTEIVFKPR